MFHHTKLTLFITLTILALAACQSTKSSKINFDTSFISDQGLHNGVALSYEFCIPRDSTYLKKTEKIDANVEVFGESPGRIGCTTSQWLCISNTQQRDYRKVLRKLARQDFIQRIDQCFFE